MVVDEEAKREPIQDPLVISSVVNNFDQLTIVQENLEDEDNLSGEEIDSDDLGDDIAQSKPADIFMQQVQPQNIFMA